MIDNLTFNTLLSSTLTIVLKLCSIGSVESIRCWMMVGCMCQDIDFYS